MMLKVGITGGIGSGKTTVCKLFEKLDIPVYYADDRAKKLLAEDQKVINQVKKLLGESIYKNGQPDRKKIAEIVFNDNEKLNQLNKIIHPAVAIDQEKWQQDQEKNNVPYTLKEAALLFETGSYKQLDKIIVVDAPEALRIERVIKRDKVSEKEVKARMNKQWDAALKVQKADFVIDNSEKAELIPQVRAIQQKLIKLAQ